MENQFTFEIAGNHLRPNIYRLPRLVIKCIPENPTRFSKIGAYEKFIVNGPNIMDIHVTNGSIWNLMPETEKIREYISTNYFALKHYAEIRRNEEVRVGIKMAQQNLEMTRMLLDFQKWSKAISQAYDTVFIAAKMICIVNSIDIEDCPLNNTEAAIVIYAPELIKTGDLPKNFIERFCMLKKWLQENYNICNENDTYWANELAEASVEFALEMVHTAERKLDQYCKTGLQDYEMML